MTVYSSFFEIDKTLQERKPLYIRNKSRHRETGAQMMTVLNFPTAEGGRSFNIPRTAIAFNICDHIDPDALRQSESFRRLLNNGTIEVVSEEEALIERGDPAQEASFRAAYNEANNTYVARSDEKRKNKEASASDKAERQKASSAGMKNIIAAMDPKLAEALNLMNADGQRADPKLESNRSTRLTALEARVKSGSTPSTAVVGELSLMLADLTVADLQGVASGSFWPHDAQVWARDRIAYQMKADNARANAAAAKEQEEA